MPELTTFVFTDLVGSVDLKSRMPGGDAAERDAAYVRLVLTPHRELIEAGLGGRSGRVVSTAGDGHFLAFADAVQAALWAIGVQQRHSEQPIAVGSDGDRAGVRIGLHVGPPQIDPADENNFIGRAVDYAARLCDAATADQILASRSAASLLEDAGLQGVRLHGHGRRLLRGIGEVEVNEVLYGGRPPSPPRGADPNAQAPASPRRHWTVLPPTMTLTQYASGTPAPGSAASSTLAAPVKRVGNYELGELIGAGGMGNVYRARHTLFGRTRAVKLIKPELVAAGGESVVRRFYQEVQATGSIEHPNLVVAIDSSSPDDAQHYLVMEYVDGVGVDRVLEAGRMRVADACEIARQACLGLAHLDQSGLVHRDVKPSNLMLALARNDDPSADPAAAPARRVVVKLMDLGLALLDRGDQNRVTRVGHGGMGTGHYMSPEQWRTTSVDIRADIYSMGCTLYHLVTGRPPFAESDFRPEKAHEREPTPRLDPAEAPPELADLLTRAMAKRPEDRHQTPLELARELAPLAEGHGLQAVVQRHRAGDAPTGLPPAPPPAGETFGGRAAIDTRGPQPADTPSTAGGGRGIAWGAALIAALVVAGAFAWIAGERRQAILRSHKRAMEFASVAAAQSMEGQIEQRFELLRSLAADKNLVAWMTALDDGQSPETQRQLQSWIANQMSISRRRFDSNSWFVTDRRGVQLARWPLGSSIGESFAHRDYFHGRGPDFDGADPSPIQHPHQSSVYASSSTGELKVAFSTPIRAAGGGVVGVLAMSVAFGEFEALLRADDPSIELLLVNTARDDVGRGEQDTGLVMQHNELAEYPNRVFRLQEEIVAQLRAERRRGLLPEYDDVFGRDNGPYWGFYTQVGMSKRLGLPASGWVVIAQEPIP